MTRHRKGNNVAKGAGSPPRRPPNETLKNLKRLRSPPEATFSKFGRRPIGEATPFQPPSSALLPDETESALATRPAPRWAGVRIGRLSRRLLCVCIPFCSGAAGGGGGESDICKTRKPFQMGRPGAFPRPEGTEPVGVLREAANPNAMAGPPAAMADRALDLSLLIFKACRLRGSRREALSEGGIKPHLFGASPKTASRRVRDPVTARKGYRGGSKI